MSEQDELDKMNIIVNIYGICIIIMIIMFTIFCL